MVRDMVRSAERGSHSRLWAVVRHYRSSSRKAKLSGVARGQATKVFAYLATLSGGSAAKKAADPAAVRNASLCDHATLEGRDARCALSNLSASMAEYSVRG
ncbi:hypothetical protein [Streptomyces lydicamycinicus]|uniref:hypothetical protein n=1 Tax=Streptomyces lydicamycinicus TaxID=1546107 RepID=UPI003C309F60